MQIYGLVYKERASWLVPDTLSKVDRVPKTLLEAKKNDKGVYLFV